MGYILRTGIAVAAGPCHAIVPGDQMGTTAHKHHEGRFVSHSQNFIICN